MVSARCGISEAIGHKAWFNRLVNVLVGLVKWGVDSVGRCLGLGSSRGIRRTQYGVGWMSYAWQHAACGQQDVARAVMPLPMTTWQTARWGEGRRRERQMRAGPTNVSNCAQWLLRAVVGTCADSWVVVGIVHYVNNCRPL
ncbi:hypothetical protein Salat_1981200 [Sesamum alatum]|uniref:Uncharacterized protein n=1 Tax=Sesamum alatum TaxID=300844 RepID=A0AAE1XYE4_9LAMI|nr:hypothetical protein Salat_1981200 [Sesamum alatum]